MWCAYLTSHSVAENLAKNRTSVVRAFLNARYYNGTPGQFLSEDPVFLGDPKSQVLTDPQSLNSYSYANDNPIVKSDPSGKIAGVDDTAGFLVGGTAGFGLQAAQSYVTGQPLTWGSAAGAFLAGGIAGVGAVNAPETGGLSAVAAGAAIGGAAGAAGNLTKQTIDIRTGVQNTGFSTKDLAVTTGTGIFFGGLFEGGVSSARIPLLSAGRNNFYALGQSAQTRIANGFASSMSVSTAFKYAVGAQANSAYRTIANTLVEIQRTLNSLSQQRSTPSK